MAVHSQTVAAKRKIVELVKAALPAVQVTYSHPGDAQRAEGVFLGDSRIRQDVPVARAGRRVREENIEVDVHCVAVKPGEYADLAEARAFELAAEVEDALADDGTLGGIATVGAKVSDIESIVYMDSRHEGWGCQVTVRVEIRSRLA